MKKILPAIFLLIPCLSYSQKWDYNLAAKYSNGFILRHSKEIGSIANFYPRGFQLVAERNHYGYTSWESRTNYPTLGFTFHYTDYRSKYLGESYGLSGHYSKTFGSINHFLNLKFGLGVGYHSQIYDRELNSLNHLLGTRLSFEIPISIEYRRKLIENLYGSIGIELLHYSNGAIKKPNKGINIINPTIGMLYHINKNIETKFDDSELNTIENAFYVSLSSGIHQPQFIGTTTKPFINLMSYYMFGNNDILKWTAGLDAFWSYALKEERFHDPSLNQNDLPDYKRLAITAGFEYHINRVSFLGQIGIYMYSPYNPYSFIYERIGLKYRLVKNIYTGLFVKAHYANAEMAEINVGIKL